MSIGRVRSQIPLFASLLIFVLVSLLAAALVNIAIVLLLPRPTPEIYRMSDIEQLLAGGRAPAAVSRQLIVRITTKAPGRDRGALYGRVEQHLARDLGISADEVRFQPLASRVLLELPPSAFRSHRGRWRRIGELPPGEPGPPPPNGGPPAAELPSIMIGPFRVGVKLNDDRWRVVETRPRGLFDPWAQRILLWFLGTALALTPVAYLFARRLASPFTAFASAAERLGHDPNAPPLDLQGGAEITVAARAFNNMQDRLRRYVQDRTAMIGAVAHDLRTPLTRLRFHAESAPPALRDKMTADIAEMDSMVAAVLAFVRDASQPHERVRLELRSLLDTLAAEFADAGADVRVLPAEPMVIEGDTLALKRLFRNLIENAVKFGGLARVRLARADGMVTVDVEDDGPGLRPEDMERVFEAFQRAETSRNRQTGGIGLGLTVARSIARSHGGDITLANRMGGGLKVSAHLPV